MATKKSFENSINELQVIIDDFQKGDITLNDSVKLYKKALNLIEFCQKELLNAKLEVEYINESELENE